MAHPGHTQSLCRLHNCWVHGVQHKVFRNTFSTLNICANKVFFCTKKQTPSLSDVWGSGHCTATKDVPPRVLQHSLSLYLSHFMYIIFIYRYKIKCLVGVFFFGNLNTKLFKNCFKSSNRRWKKKMMDDEKRKNNFEMVIFYLFNTNSWHLITNCIYTDSLRTTFALGCFVIVTFMLSLTGYSFLRPRITTNSHWCWITFQIFNKYLQHNRFTFIHIINSVNITARHPKSRSASNIFIALPINKSHLKYINLYLNLKIRT